MQSFAKREEKRKKLSYIPRARAAKESLGSWRTWMGMMMVVSSQHVGRERGDTNWK